MSTDTMTLSAAAAHRILRTLAEGDFESPSTRLDMGVADAAGFAMVKDAIQAASSAEAEVEADTSEAEIVVDLVRPTDEEIQVILAEAAASVA
jgi:RsiW-degrading membrane proteinase PrsW (M82 family)